MKELEAVRALIKHEITQDYYCEFKVSSNGEGKFEVSFDESYPSFNCLTIKVDEIDEQSPEYSKFSVLVGEDIWEEFIAFDWSIKELWKALLWR